MHWKVLVVDDDEVIVLLHTILIQEHGLSKEPKGFLNGKEAWEYLKKDEEDCSYLIFLDINMPVMSGWELLEHLQAHPNPEKFFVIMVTSSVDSKDHERARSYPQVLGYFEKPLEDRSFKKLRQLPALSPFFANMEVRQGIKSTPET